MQVTLKKKKNMVGGSGVLGGLIHGKGNGQVSVQVVLKKMVCGWRLFAWKFKGVGFTESGLNLVKFMTSSLNEGSKQLGVPLHGHSNGQVSVQIVVGDSLARKFKETGFRVSSLAKWVVHSWGSLYMEI